MAYDWKMELYWRLPVALQEAGLSFYARHLDRLYYGPGYAEWCAELERWHTWTPGDVAAWQGERLREIVSIAASRVPHYQEAWRGFDWKAVDAPAALPGLPRLDKHAIRERPETFLVEGADPRRLWLEKTSGTTGTSLRIYWPPSMLPKWWGITEVMVRGVAGVRQEMPRGMMGGRPIVRGSATRPPFWRFNRRWRQLYLSSYHVSPCTAPGYVDAIRRYGCEWLTGYGSALAALAENALEAGLSPVPVRAVIVSGDTLSGRMRAAIEAFFACKCFDHYGQSEGVCMAMECTRGRMHVVPAAGIIEILRDDGTPCAAGEPGEIVATGLLNDVMPLIRYRIGDYAAWAEDQRCDCGNRNAIITALEGRVDDYLVTLDGRRIGRLSTAMKRSPAIHSAQIVQDRPGHAYLLVRPSNGYRPADAEAVRADIIERIGEFQFVIVEVGDIPKTPTGKTALVIRLADRPHMREVYDRILSGRQR
jgi:phenylacetate-CoA ligase